MMRLMLGVVVVLCVSLSARADVLVKKDGTRLVGDAIKVSGSSYVLKKGPATVTIPFSQTAMVAVKEPKNLRPAIKAVEAGQYTKAIPVLQQIVRQYKHLKHDVTAGSWLVTAMVGAGQHRDAITAFESLKRTVKDKKEIPIQLRRSYWEALEKTGGTAKLKSDLSDAIRYGNRAVAAEAQVRRADNQMAAGQTEAALKRGYLRTVLLFSDVKEIQPEALKKTYEAYMKLELTKKAQEYKGILMKKYPGSPEAKALK